MNPIIALLIAKAIASSSVANAQPITINQFGQPCEQVALYQCLPLNNGSIGSVVPTTTAPVAPRQFLNAGQNLHLFTLAEWGK